MTARVRRLRRLLVLLPSAAIGGAERHTATLALALAEAGVEVIAAAEPELLPGLAPLFHPLAPVAAPIGWREAEEPEANAARQARTAAALIARHAPEAALLPLPWPSHGLGLQRALAEARLPGLAIAHLAPREPVPVPAALLRPVLAAPLAWAAVSAPVAGRVEALFGLAAGQVAVVPNGVAPPVEDPARRAAQRRARRAALGLGPAAPLVLFAGRLEEKKGADLLPALAERLEEVSGATLGALGEGPLAPSLAAHPAARPGGPLRLRGPADDVGDWLLAADALVLPSRLEGCPLIALEAAARRCPVVATAAALECWGGMADSLAFVSETQSILSLTGHVSVILRKAPNSIGRIDAAEAHALRHGMLEMLSRYSVLLRGLVAGCGRYG
ncbi:glycosyltransferase family 4 protein [Belnapia sp. T18]|uniref:Glycosyltransferase family 4 protein n=1 Tax=Belnapia arida TaxID=2804533 RepID=A0ABS1TZQ4_9PROT|nr:glycosyltransferase family 4 protein [Belnapia arida]MBL6077908.1 glycosyltransferase family 4 protein [Belnapia arida]